MLIYYDGRHEIFAQQRQHDKNINELIQRLLNGEKPAAVAVNIGAGSWTGTRVGVTAGKAYSLALNIPLYEYKSPDSDNFSKETLHLPKDIEDYLSQIKLCKTTYKDCKPYYNADFSVSPFSYS
jgi:tRNA A37 threonylcarbamoyladenosine modification protein TsaB